VEKAPQSSGKPELEEWLTSPRLLTLEVSRINPRLQARASPFLLALLPGDAFAS
jgi:hypothetical protein